MMPVHADVLEPTFLHDVLNTLAAVNGYLRLATSLPADEALELVHDARRLTVRAIEEVESHRDMTAAERGEPAGRFAAVEVGPILADVVRSCLAHPAARDRIIRSTPHVRALMVWTDPVLLRRVVGNLLTNALEASRPGERVTVWFEPEAGAVHVHNFAVISHPVQARLFEAGFSTKGRGRGLGTHSARLLTERHFGGTMSFTTQEGLGTVFSVYLPPMTADVARPLPGQERRFA